MLEGGLEGEGSGNIHHINSCVSRRVMRIE